MTTTTMALTELAEKGADIDVLRQMVHVSTRRPLQAPIDGNGLHACIRLAWWAAEAAHSLDEIRAPCP